MAVKLKKTLETNKIQVVKTRSPVFVQKGTELKEVLTLMRENKRGCVIVLDKKKIVGVFAERDLLTRVIEPALSLKTPIEEIMTPNPTFLKLSSSIAEAIQLMSKQGYRHIPLLNEREDIEKFVSVRDILDYLAEHFPYEIYNLPPDPDQVNKVAEGA